MLHTKLEDWKFKCEAKDPNEAAAGEEYVFKQESDMFVCEIVAEKLAQELQVLLRKVGNYIKKTTLPNKDEYNRRNKKSFADLFFSNNLDEVEISDLRQIIVSFFYCKLLKQIRILFKTNFIFIFKFIDSSERRLK